MALSADEQIKCNIDIMKAYCDTAKSYVQIASAGLAAPLVFTQTLLGKNAAEAGLGATGVPRSLVAAWSLFLITVASGLIYQWLAIRYASNEVDGKENTFSRSFPYGVMIISFVAGALAFVVFAWERMAGKIF
jgi:hypothetical protein